MTEFAFFAIVVGFAIALSQKNTVVTWITCIIVGGICIKAASPEHWQLFADLRHNGSEGSKNVLARWKEHTETTDRVQYTVTQDTTALVSSKHNVKTDGQLWNPPTNHRDIPAGTRVITAFTREEWAGRHDTYQDGVLFIPVQLHVQGTKIGRFETAKDLMYLIPKASLIEFGEVAKIEPPPPTDNRRLNTVTVGSQLGTDGGMHTLWTVTLTGKDSSPVTVTRIPREKLYEIDQPPGVAEAPDVTVTMGGVPLPIKKCVEQRGCSYYTFARNEISMPQNIVIKNNGGQNLTLVIYDLIEMNQEKR